MKIVVDADACPKGVLAICIRLGSRYQVQVYTVASFNHHIVSDHHVTVGNASQEADMKVLTLAARDDIVITQDWGLAAMVLGKKAKAISPSGRIYEEQTIDFLLEEREAKAKFRRGGGRTKGPKVRTKADDEVFEKVLTGMLEKRRIVPCREDDIGV